MGPFWSPFIERGAGLHALWTRCWLFGQTRSPWHPLEMTSIFADLATFGAYLVIPLLIAYFLLRRRQVYPQSQSHQLRAQLRLPSEQEADPYGLPRGVFRQ